MSLCPRSDCSCTASYCADTLVCSFAAFRNVRTSWLVYFCSQAQCLHRSEFAFIVRCSLLDSSPLPASLPSSSPLCVHSRLPPRRLPWAFSKATCTSEVSRAAARVLPVSTDDDMLLLQAAPHHSVLFVLVMLYLLSLLPTALTFGTWPIFHG